MTSAQRTITGANTPTFDLSGLLPTGRPVTITGQESSSPKAASSPKSGTRQTPPGMLRQLGLSRRRTPCG